MAAVKHFWGNSMGRHYDNYWPPYISVAERRDLAHKALAQLPEKLRVDGEWDRFRIAGSWRSLRRDLRSHGD